MISVIIPVFNMEKTIRGCLEAFSVQTYPKDDFEVLVIDDASTDSTAMIVGQYAWVRYIPIEHHGPAWARNVGVQQAHGEVVLFTDADCIPQPDWVEQMVKPFTQDKSVVGVKGVYRTRQKGLTARFVQLEYEEKYDKMKKHSKIDFIDTYAAGFTRGVFLSLGGYDIEFPVACAEDVELSFRLANRGYKLVFASNAIVYHKHPDSFLAYVKKKFKFAYWRLLAVKKNPNKFIRDSHTPQSMKIQAVLMLGLVLSLLAGVFLDLIRITTGLLILYILTCLPFVIFALRRDIKVGLVSIFYLASRSLAQVCGLVCGAFNLIRIRSC